MGLLAVGIQLNSDLAKPMYLQICDQIRQRIVDGQIIEGARLPASRNYAADIGVSRTTIVSAYEQLAAEGYIEGRGGSGFYVRPITDIKVSEKPRKIASTNAPPIIREEKPRSPQPSVSDMRLFPYQKWAQCIARAARASPEALIFNPDNFGDYRLRQAIAEYLGEWRGVVADPAQIIMTAGSGDALELCVRTLIKSGERVGLENPGYFPLRNFVTSQGMEPYWLEIENGEAALPTSRRGTAPRMVVLTPSHQFPLGGTMSPRRRAEFINWAAKSESWIIEDDYDSEFRYAGRPIPAMASFDPSARTLYLGTFSKVFSIGLRLGYIVAPISLVERFAETLSAFGVKASISSQRALAMFIEDGEFYRHIRRVRRIYGQRRKHLIDLLQSDFSDVLQFDDHQAGMHLVVRFSQDIDDQRIAEQVNQQGGVTRALSSYYSSLPKQRGLILGFCAFTEQEIQRNLQLVGREIARC